MLTAQIGLINPTDYWSTARSGGQDGLGIIAANPEINRTLRGPGIVPNDLELSRIRSYLPLHHGWVVESNQTYWPGSLGQTEEDELAKKLVRAERIKAWMAVLSGVSSAAVAIMLAIALSRGRGM